MGLAHSPRIVTDGLVLCLDAANPKSYPGTGTVINDLTSGGYNSTLLNGVGYSSSNNGVLTFDGTNDYISTPFTYANNDDFTMSCWFKAPVAQRCGLIGIRRGFRTTDWYQSQIYIAGDALSDTVGSYLQFSDFVRQSNGSYDAIRTTFTNTVSVTDNQWKYLVITSDSVGAKIYINAVKIDEAISTPKPTRFEEANFLVGAAGNWPNNPLSGYYFNGQMSNINFYTKALSAEEIRQNFNALRGRYGI